MKSWWILLLAFSLLGCNTAPPVDEEPAEVPTSLTPIPELGEDPALTNDVWLNTEEPLRLVNMKDWS